MKRTYWLADLSIPGNPPGKYQPKEESEANLVSSLLENGNHAPAIDLDLPCRLLESSTPGNHHLYIEKELSWDKYKILLEAFYRVGLIQNGFYFNALANEQTLLRKPGVKKNPLDFIS
jgi:hypothetical protein